MKEETDNLKQQENQQILANANENMNTDDNDLFTDDDEIIVDVF